MILSLLYQFLIQISFQDVVHYEILGYQNL